jgi:4-hydroxybenzoate polyprenyltransferase
MAWLRKIIEKIEDAPTGFFFWLSSFLSIIALRLLIENWLDFLRSRSGLFIFYEFTHTFLFFLIAYIVIVEFLKRILKSTYQKISNILLLGYFMILTPPILDYFISGGQGFWSFYKFDSLTGLFWRFLTFFGDKPEIGITYGVRIEVALAIIFIFAYIFLKSKKIILSFLGAIGAYAIFFVLGTFPSWITIAFEGFSKGFLNVGEIDTAELFLSPVRLFSREIPEILSSLNIKMSIMFALFLTGLVFLGLFLNYKERLIAFLKNARLPQIIYHFGLLSAGAGLALKLNNSDWGISFFNIFAFFLVAESVILAWLSSVVANDIIDRKIDEETNSFRPLIKNIFSEKNYAAIGIMLFFVSILFSAIVSFKIALLFLIYHALAWIYSMWPLRLKRFPFVSTFVSALASLMIFISGFVFTSPNQSIRSLPFSIIALLVISLTLSLPIKDFKDIEGDKNDGVETIPVFFGEYWGKVIVAGGVFLSFLLSVVFLNEPRLFWWALALGGFSFWAIINMEKENGGPVTCRNIFWWMLGNVSVYGLILVKIIFFTN